MGRLGRETNEERRSDDRRKSTSALGRHYEMDTNGGRPAHPPMPAEDQVAVLPPFWCSPMRTRQFRTVSPLPLAGFFVLCSPRTSEYWRQIAEEDIAMKSTKLIWRGRIKVALIAFLVFVSHGVPRGYGGPR